MTSVDLLVIGVLAGGAVISLVVTVLFWLLTREPRPDGGEAIVPKQGSEP
jgi:uncharacterized membrane protein